VKEGTWAAVGFSGEKGMWTADGPRSNPLNPGAGVFIGVEGAGQRKAAIEQGQDGGARTRGPTPSSNHQAPHPPGPPPKGGACWNPPTIQFIFGFAPERDVVGNGGGPVSGGRGGAATETAPPLVPLGALSRPASSAEGDSKGVAWVRQGRAPD